MMPLLSFLNFPQPTGQVLALKSITAPFGKTNWSFLVFSRRASRDETFLCKHLTEAFVFIDIEQSVALALKEQNIESTETAIIDVNMFFTVI